MPLSCGCRKTGALLPRSTNCEGTCIMARREPAPKPLDEDLVGYLLDVLDEPARRATEAHLNANPDARRKLDLLRRALAPLDSTRESAEPPAGLAERTLALVSRHQGSKL